jgi:hypothetical protein
MVASARKTTKNFVFIGASFIEFDGDNEVYANSPKKQKDPKKILVFFRPLVGKVGAKRLFLQVGGFLCTDLVV